MMEPERHMDPVLLIFVIVVATVGFVLNYWLTAARRKELSAWAASRGLSFSPHKDRAFNHRFPAFDILKKGNNRYAYNIMEGSWSERGCVAFDYHYRTGSGKNSHHHYISGLIISSPLPLKPLFIRPENMLDRVAEFVGVDDIDFESAEFSRRFFVKSPDRKWAYDVLHQRAMDFLLRMPNFYVQFSAHAVLAYRNTKFQSSDFDVAGTLIEGLLDGLPAYLVEQQGGEPGGTAAVRPAVYPDR